ncbi:sodium/glutamate symporter [Streptobacillus notomytis]|uniref:sodium/glutamate symporter n=1 Tax=Streptobacillus notomytis TaxID=1712031 RepID=UPI0009366DFB|nr:sodium/glutamate symporter [Streptobacillus notomytis]
MRYIIELDMIQTIGIAVIFLILGIKLKKRVILLQKYCIPNPIIGGIIFSGISLILRYLKIVEFNFDTTLQNFFMIMFFTSIGFNASFKLLTKGGVKLIYFLFVAVLLIFFQNGVALIVGKFLNINPLIALMTGSTPMTGGHGTSIAISESIKIDELKTIAIASATFGTVIGSLIGPPLAKRLIQKYNLKSHDEVNDIVEEDNEIHELDEEKFAKAFFILLLSMSVGTILNIWFKKIGLEIPVYIGPMFVASIIRNLFDVLYKEIPLKEIQTLEGISLSLFLSVALISLKLWQLFDLAGPLSILLLAQVITIYLFIRYITFNIMGGNFDAAVISAGHMGFGMGATPNGLANMKSINEEFGYSKLAFLVVPIVGALFIDFFNISIITFFIQYFG